MLYDQKWDADADLAGVHASVFEALTKDEIRALISVRDDLASGRIEARHFSMWDVVYETACGTVCCIAGHLSIRVGRSHKEANQWYASVANGGTEALQSLFAPGNFGGPLRAACAITHYLATGDGVWPK